MFEGTEKKTEGDALSIVDQLRLERRCGRNGGWRLKVKIWKLDEVAFCFFVSFLRAHSRGFLKNRRRRKDFGQGQ